MSSKNNLFENCLCTYDLGCVYYLKLSLFWGSNNLLKNVSNINSGGSYYLENSNLYLRNEILTESHSDYYASCMLAENSTINLENIFSSNFSNGCLNFLNSSVIGFNLTFDNINKIFSKNFDDGRSSLYSVDTLSLRINYSCFLGNMNFDKGGVIIF